MKKARNYPEVVCGTLIVNNSGEVLLIKSKKWRDSVYHLPGGHVEFGERFVDAVKREVKEETGLRVNGVRFLNFREEIFPPTFERKVHFIAVQYSCRASSNAVKLNDELSEYVWAKLRKALSMPISDYVRRNIKDYIKLEKK